MDSNNLLLKYKKYESHKLNIVPMNLKELILETHGNSAFQISNQQGIVCLLRENAKSRKVNYLAWRSKRAERRTWSTLAAETQAVQKAMDKAIHAKCVFRELRIGVYKNLAVTDNLSLRRVLYSGRPVQEDRLKKELVVIRDMIMSEDIEVRYVPGKFMLAECLTKSANPDYLMSSMKNNLLNTVNLYDAEQVTTEMIEEAGVDIPMENLRQARQRPFVPCYENADSSDSDS